VSDRRTTAPHLERAALSRFEPALRHAKVIVHRYAALLSATHLPTDALLAERTVAELTELGAIIADQDPPTTDDGRRA